MATNRLTGALKRLGGAASDQGCDRALLDRFVAGDPAAFDALLARHGPMILTVCRRILPDPAAADDAFQATFLVLLTKAGSIGRGEAVGNWLYGVACRTAARARVDAARRRSREAAAPTRVAPDPLAEITGRELVAALDQEVLRLAPRYRSPVVLCYLRGMTRDEAADELGWSPATLGRRLGRGRDLLRARLSRRGLELSAALLPAALAGGVSAASIPGRLAAPLLATAVMAASGKPVPSGTVPAAVESLTQGVLQAMFVAKMRIVVALLAAGLGAVGVGTLTLGGFGGRPVQAGPQVPPNVVRPSPVAPPKAAEPRDPFAVVLGTVKGIESKTEQVVLLIRVAQSQADAGKKDEARETFRQALDLADALTDDTPRGMALREIATGRLRLGDVEAAIAVATKVKGDSPRNQFLFLLAQQQAEADDIPGARKTAAAITDDQKDGALDAVGRAEARAGDVDAAKKTADALKHQPLSRASVLAELALAQAKAGDRIAAAESLAEALRLNVTTLAEADSRNRARAENAVSLAKIGDIAGARKAAAGLDLNPESGRSDRVYALRLIAVEQVKQGDRPGAVKTLGDIPAVADRARAWLEIAEAQAEAADRAGAAESIQAARTLAESVPESARADLLEDVMAVRAGVLVKAGDVKGAAAVADALKDDRSRCHALLAVARAQIKTGDRGPARVTLGRAMKAAGGIPEGQENQGGVMTIVPAWALIKGSVVRQLTAAATEAGGEADARAWAAGLKSPFVQTMALIGVAEGVATTAASGKKPDR